MDISMEIRKLPYNYIQELACILGSSWKKLMVIIPKYLDENYYQCNISVTNPHRYISDHFRLLEDASFKTQRPCLEILFCEWGTSGRVRPDLGHLLHLLIKAELYRAADYVAIVLLEQLSPIRPQKGPAALVNTTLPDLREQEIKNIVESLNYPSSLISYLISNSQDVNLNSNVPNVRPKVKKIHSGSSISSAENNRKRHMHEITISDD
ncbi:hypothetical protein ILUMI_25541 [Ignelater luminosus]|uniref:Tube Death domain-containing protein n=1 Tax=Ignelater luminosus TaxID=2038154 RepID=A0A8K0FXV0_IGNLU|nr:hypothetical protein ILUMI_25541 [Ignelater luminosus]